MAHWTDVPASQRADEKKKKIGSDYDADDDLDCCDPENRLICIYFIGNIMFKYTAKTLYRNREYIKYNQLLYLVPILLEKK